MLTLLSKVPNLLVSISLFLQNTHTKKLKVRYYHFHIEHTIKELLFEKFASLFGR